MRKKIVYKYITAGMLSLAAVGVSASPLRVVVTDADTGAPVEFAAMALTQGDSNIGALTDAEGVFAADPAPGKWMLTVSAVGYTAVHREIKIGADPSVITIALKQTYTQIGEVVVTAREGRGMTSASLIDQTAMQHLQPSSFTDLMEMLPGAVSKDPEMGKANLADLRQAKNITQTDNYATSSLGTAFVFDGVQTNTNAEMQQTADATRADRLTTGKGVDMRSISTDDIESVEVVRGIASAEYGETTSGLVNIRRKSGASALQARFKADMQSQLFYVGKGVQMPVDGFDAYLFTAATCLEGRWGRRIVLGLLGLGVLAIYFMQPAPQAYNGMLVGALIFTLLLILLSSLSVNRFKEGLID